MCVCMYVSECVCVYQPEGVNYAVLYSSVERCLPLKHDVSKLLFNIIVTRSI